MLEHMLLMVALGAEWLRINSVEPFRRNLRRFLASTANILIGF